MRTGMAGTRRGSTSATSRRGTGRTTSRTSAPSTSAAGPPGGRYPGTPPPPPDLEPVPTLAELAAQGLARQEVDPRNGTRYYRVSAEGQTILSDSMARNAARSRAWEARG